MGKPKVIVCATAYRPLVGGSEIAIEEVARRLAGDFDFWILTARFSRAVPARENGPEGTILRLGFGTRFDQWLLPFFAVWRAHSIIRASDRVLVWGMDISQGAMGAFLINIFFPRTPFIFTVQYGESEDYLNRGRFGLIGFAFRLMLARADFVTVISSYLLGIVRARGFCGPVALIHNGVDGKRAAMAGANRKGPGGMRVLTVSRLVHKNGIDTLIRAVAKVKMRIPEVRLDIAGEGPERKKLEKIIEEENLGGIARLLGNVPYGQLWRLYAGADVVVRLSRSEGMGNIFVEALAVGTPVIGTSVGGISDIIKDGDTGLLANVDDSGDAAQKIEAVLTDRAFAARLGEAGRAFVAGQFSWDPIARAYGDVFRTYGGIKKRVVIATGLFPPDIGGPATYSALLVDVLPREHIGMRVSYFGAVRHLPRIMRHAIYFLRLLFAARGSDVIFAQDPVSVGLPALIAARLLRKRFLLKVVGDYGWEQEQQRFSISHDQFSNFETLEDFQNRRHGLVTEVRRGIQKFVARHADRVIVPSGYLRGIVAGWGGAAEKISVVYNAVMMPERWVPRDEARERFGLSGMVIIAVGRLVPWKGFAILIEAVADLAEEFPDMRLVVAGSGPEEKNLRGIIAERDAMERIQIIGAIAHRVLMDYFSASDIFVLNSGYEGLSHSLIEAMAAGLPVVATAIGGNPEVVTDGEEGILIPYGNKEKLKDALRALAANADMRVVMGRAARTRAAAFTQEKMIRETAALLKNI